MNNINEKIKKKLKILKKEKKVLEDELMKLPIRNKKEINDSMNQIEKDLN